MDNFSLVNNFMDCPNCGSKDHIKAGFARGHQRYKCKRCQKNYTVPVRSTDCLPEIKQLAQEMYLEGLGFRAIGRLLKVSHTAVYYWIKKAGQTVLLTQDDNKPIDVVEIDEMPIFYGKKAMVAR